MKQLNRRIWQFGASGLVKLIRTAVDHQTKSQVWKQTINLVHLQGSRSQVQQNVDNQIWQYPSWRPGETD